MAANTENTFVQDTDKSAVRSSLMKKGRKSIAQLQKMKDNGEKIVQVSPASCDPYFAMMCDLAGVDILRYTAPGENVEMRAGNLAWWTREIRRTAPNIFLNAYMQTQQFANKYTALENASILAAEGADSVIPMGVNNETLKYLSDNHIVVFGHVGALSGWQTGRYGGYKRMGSTAEDAMKVFRMAYEYQENGMMGMTIELVPREVTNAIAKKLRVPVVGVAAGGAADGSELVMFDLFGMMPKDKMGVHAKVYGDLIQFGTSAFSAFANDVRTGGYPLEEHGFGMEERELDTFLNLLDQKH